MNTIIIWDTLGEEPIKFAVIEEDLFHLDKTYINNDDADETKLDELTALMFNANGTYKQHMSEEFPFDAYRPGETRVIVAGFIP